MKGKMLLALLLGAVALWLLPSRVSSITPKAPTSLDWPNYGNDLHNTRFQDVDQINVTTAKNLQVAWVFHTGVLDPLAELQVAPIVVNGKLFVTDGHDHVFALDPATGKLIWAYRPIENDDMPKIEDMIVCCGRNNKGVAVAAGNVI